MRYLIFFALYGLLSSCIPASPPEEDDTPPALPSPISLRTTSDLEWGPLNPARGANSPQAANLWGDRSAPGASGFLVEFKEGFSSPPHIHNVSYRAIVIEGSVHNDDPDAADMWMPPGSFWTQPAGESHVTSAASRANVAYVEIDSGPYLVQPVEEVFDNGQRPVNIHADNLVWREELPQQITVDSQESAPARGAEVAYLWHGGKNGNGNGVFLRIPAGFDGSISVEGNGTNAILTRGVARYEPAGADALKLEPGSTFSAEGGMSYHVSTLTTEGAVFYLRWND